MLRRNGTLTACMLATVCVAGCANSNENLSQNSGFQGKGPRSSIDPRRIKDVKPPKIRPETHLAAGRMFESRGQWRKALVQYRKAVAVNSRSVEGYHRLGLLASRAGSHDEAIEAFRGAVALKPKDAILRNNLGFELLGAERFDEAKDALTQAVKLDPTFARAQVNLGILQCKLGRFDDGLDSFLTVLPEADAFYNLGLMYRGQKRYLEASRAFRQVLVIEPDFTAAVTQIQKMKEHMPRARLPRPAPKFAARTTGRRSPEMATDSGSSQPDRRHGDVPRATQVDPAAQRTDDSHAWESAFAMLDKAMGSMGAVDAFPMTGVPPSLEGYPLDERTALEEIARNERDCILEEADRRADAIGQTLDGTGKLASADRAEVIACEAVEVCDADDALLASISTDDRAAPACFIDGRPMAGTRDARRQPRAASPADELRRVLQASAPMVVNVPFPAADMSPADPASYDDAWTDINMSPLTYAVSVEESMTDGDFTEWDLAPVRVQKEKVSSVDSLALLRTLQDELAIVRNNIECADENARLASASARRCMTPSTERQPRPQSGVLARSNGLVGPPAWLAIPARRRTESAPTAILASRPSKTGSTGNKTQVDAKRRSRKETKKPSRRTKTSQATGMRKNSRSADLRGAFGHEPSLRPD